MFLVEVRVMVPVQIQLYKRVPVSVYGGGLVQVWVDSGERPRMS